VCSLLSVHVVIVKDCPALVDDQGFKKMLGRESQGIKPIAKESCRPMQ